MDLRGARILFPGATGEIGRALAVWSSTRRVEAMSSGATMMPGADGALEVVR
ncbi:hypothetical protein [Streptomyces sp. NPDC096013]|uniref:hypothetical protein n=1 Tax=Streptomyces sp. NPDC096013 TaxID=3366069 RepID=UPI00381957F3